MYKRVLETVVDSLAKERLDQIVFQSDEYVKVDDEAKENLEKVRNMLSIKR